jgi:glucose uptake protein GlcU
MHSLIVAVIAFLAGIFTSKERRSAMNNKRIHMVVAVVVIIVLAAVFISMAGPGLMKAIIAMHTGR